MSAIQNNDTYTIQLPLFEGPFDLLLFFIERDELDIKNIPIARITGDFLAYIKAMEAINIDLASEFIVTAATLMKIKARMLLPLKKKDETNEIEDPREELVNKILIFKSFKEIASELSQLENLQSQLHSRGNIQEDIKRIRTSSLSFNELESANLYNLVKIFNRLMDRLGKPDTKPVHKILDYPYTIWESKEDVLKKLTKKAICSFIDLFDSCESRIHAVIQFLAILEMINLQEIEMINGNELNNFWIKLKSQEPAISDS